MSEFVPGAPTGYVKLLKELRAALLRRKVYAEFHTGSVEAGGEATVAALGGPAVLKFVIFTVVGSSTDARKAKLVLEVDGEAVEYPELEKIGWTTGSWNTPKIFVSGWNDDAFTYSMGIELGYGFRESCVVKLVNGDPNNPVNYNLILMYARVRP